MVIQIGVVGFHEFDTMFQVQGHWQEVNLTFIILVQTLLTLFHLVYLLHLNSYNFTSSNPYGYFML